MNFPEPKIEIFPPKKLIGQKLESSIADDKTFLLWRNFMPRRNEITNAVNKNLFSLQCYPESFDFFNFNIHAKFEKWAAVEVRDFAFVPEGMSTHELAGGMYAVFPYKGNPVNAASFFQYIFTQWLPNSEYVLDEREHFEILDERYKNNQDDSEEDIFIPIKNK